MSTMLRAGPGWTTSPSPRMLKPPAGSSVPTSSGNRVRAWVSARLMAGSCRPSRPVMVADVARAAGRWRRGGSARSVGAVPTAVAPLGRGSWTARRAGRRARRGAGPAVSMSWASSSSRAARVAGERCRRCRRAAGPRRRGRRPRWRRRVKSSSSAGSLSMLRSAAPATCSSTRLAGSRSMAETALGGVLEGLVERGRPDRCGRRGSSGAWVVLGELVEVGAVTAPSRRR